MKSSARLLALASLVAIVVAGCGAPPEAQSEGNPDAFTGLAPAQQKLIEQGRVAVGFDQDSVRLALGDPDTVTTTSSGVEIWHFRTYTAAGKQLFTGYFQRDRRHGMGWNGWWGRPYPYYIDYPDRVATERVNVEFDDGRVSAVTRESL